MYSLQELIEHGYVDSITTDGTHLGDGYTIVVKLSRYSIGKITINVGIDEYLDDAVTLINGIIDIQESLNKEAKPEEKPTIRHVTDPDEIKEILSGTAIKDTKIEPEDYAE
jgi:hypothetical protein